MLMYCDLWTKWSKIEQQTGLLLATNTVYVKRSQYMQVAYSKPLTYYKVAAFRVRKERSLFDKKK